MPFLNLYPYCQFALKIDREYIRSRKARMTRQKATRGSGRAKQRNSTIKRTTAGCAATSAPQRPCAGERETRYSRFTGSTSHATLTLCARASCE